MDVDQKPGLSARLLTRLSSLHCSANFIRDPRGKYQMLGLANACGGRTGKKAIRTMWNQPDTGSCKEGPGSRAAKGSGAVLGSWRRMPCSGEVECC